MSSTPNEFLAALHEWTDIFMRRSMKNFFQFAKDLGLSMSQFTTLGFLKRCGSVGISDIGENLGITSAAASQMVDRLVQLGLVERSEDPIDRRIKRITLKQQGVETLRGSLRARQQWQDQLVDLLSPQEQAQIAAALHILIDKANQLSSPPANEFQEDCDASKEG